METKQINLLKREYAKLLVKFGLNIKKGMLIELELPLDDMEFNHILLEECYKTGAKRVIVNYVDDYAIRLHNIYGNKKELSTVYDYEVERVKLFVKENAPVLVGFSHHYDDIDGVDVKKVSDIHKARSTKLSALHNKHMFSCHWSGFAIPSVSWAKKLFSKLSDEKALNKLWEVIFKCTYVEKGKSITNWKKHDAALKKQVKWLNSLNIKTLHYTNKLGTDLTIELIPNTTFIGGTHSINGVAFNPNFPTEEVFTSPNKFKTNGIVYSSKPLILDGVMIDDFNIRFKDGRIVEVHAKKNEQKLKDIINTDEGSHYLGECALVPFSSPVNKSGILFYDSLYDENACCHLAFGIGFPLVFEDYMKKDLKDLYKQGLNTSSTHIDFMIGTKDLNIVATTKDNKKVVLFKQGEWAK